MTDWRVRRAYQEAGLTVLVVESLKLMPTTSPGACHLVAGLAPQAVVVLANGRTLAYDADGGAIGLAALDERFRGVRQAMDAHRSSGMGARTTGSRTERL